MIFGVMKKIIPILLAFLLAFGLGCPSETQVRFDSVQGQIINADGIGIVSARVYTSMGTNLEVGITDSGATETDGSYMVQNGLPYTYTSGSGCGSEPTFTSMTG